MGPSTATTGQSNSSYDLSFKILLIGDSGVGKSSLLVSFISNAVDDLAPTIGTLFAPFSSVCVCVNANICCEEKNVYSVFSCSFW